MPEIFEHGSTNPWAAGFLVVDFDLKIGASSLELYMRVL
jgi:hypothetical protein